MSPTPSVPTDERSAAALEAVDEIEAVFIDTRGFPEEVPSELCADLCGCDVCDQNGCIFRKTALVRAILALPTVETVNGDGEMPEGLCLHNQKDDATIDQYSVQTDADGVLFMFNECGITAQEVFEIFRDGLRARASAPAGAGVCGVSEVAVEAAAHCLFGLEWDTKTHRAITRKALEAAALCTVAAMARWRTDMSAAPRDKEVWLFSPAQALGPHEKDDVRLARPRDWGWATMWMPAYIPAPPPVAEEGTKS